MPPTRMKNPIRLEIRMRRRRLAEKKGTRAERQIHAWMGASALGVSAPSTRAAAFCAPSAMAPAVRRAACAVCRAAERADVIPAAAAVRMDVAAVPAVVADDDVSRFADSEAA